MKIFFIITLLSITVSALALPPKYRELLPYVQAAPNQGETNTCWFMASTGAMELLLNKKDKIKNPKVGGKNDLSESFLIWQRDFYDPKNPPVHFLEEVVTRFNYQEAVHNKHWPYNAFNEDQTPNMDVWNKHPKFDQLPRLKVPKLSTKFLFARGKKWSTQVLNPEDITTIKEALVKYRSPIIVNYNDDGFWHVVLIVGYDDRTKGVCYEIDKKDCNKRGAFFVRDSDGMKYEARAYNWFIYNGNAAAVVKLKTSATN